MITIGIPSINRLDSLRRCINSIAATIGTDFRICVGFSDEIGYNHLPPYPYVDKTLLLPREYYVKDLNRTFDFMKDTAPEEEPLDYILITQDDSEFIKPGWGPLVVNSLHRNFPHGMGAIEMFNPNGFSNYITRASLFDQFDGKLLPEEYKHYFADSVRRQQLIDQGAFQAFNFSAPKDAIVHHPLYATTDPTGLEAREKWFDRDKAIYEKR